MNIPYIPTHLTETWKDSIHTLPIPYTVTYSAINEWYHSKQLNTWEFEVGTTPLSTWMAPIVTIASYLIIIQLLRTVVSLRGKPFELRPIVFIHNMFLSVSSLVLFVGLLYDIYRLWSAHSFWEFFCDVKGEFYYGRHYYFYYINYIFKYIELIDTFLLAIRGKPLLFLHVYHHSATLLLCFTQLRAQSCVQWVPIIINLFIHIWMYSYYAFATLNWNIWWKRYLTIGQIIQFFVGIAACFVALGSLTIYTFVSPDHPLANNCRGDMFNGGLGVIILLSYLALFIQLYFSLYNSKKKKSKKVD